MKSVVIIGDGMSDWPIESLGGRTPLEAADKPNMDFMAANGAWWNYRWGYTQTAPPLPIWPYPALLAVFLAIVLTVVVAGLLTPQTHTPPGR